MNIVNLFKNVKGNYESSVSSRAVMKAEFTIDCRELLKQQGLPAELVKEGIQKLSVNANLIVRKNPNIVQGYVSQDEAEIKFYVDADNVFAKTGDSKWIVGNNDPALKNIISDLNKDYSGHYDKLIQYSDQFLFEEHDKGFIIRLLNESSDGRRELIEFLTNGKFDLSRINSYYYEYHVNRNFQATNVITKMNYIEEGAAVDLLMDISFKDFDCYNDLTIPKEVILEALS
jgi:hypothetical protein